MTTRIINLKTFDHWCMHPDQCSDIVLEKAKVGPAGKVRKLVLCTADGRLSRFWHGSVDGAVAWAKRHGFEIPQEDLDTCRRLTS